MDAHEKTLRDLFGTLHRELVEQLIQRVRDNECPAAVMKEAREMLKDNHITDAGKRLDSPIRRLADELPFQDPDENIA